MSKFLRSIQQGLKLAEKRSNDFTIIRNGQEIGTVKGFVCSKEYPNSNPNCSTYRNFRWRYFKIIK